MWASVESPPSGDTWGHAGQPGCARGLLVTVRGHGGGGGPESTAPGPALAGTKRPDGTTGSRLTQGRTRRRGRATQQPGPACGGGGAGGSGGGALTFGTARPPAPGPAARPAGSERRSASLGSAYPSRGRTLGEGEGRVGVSPGSWFLQEPMLPARRPPPNPMQQALGAPRRGQRPPAPAGVPPTGPAAPAPARAPAPNPRPQVPAGQAHTPALSPQPSPPRAHRVHCLLSPRAPRDSGGGGGPCGEGHHLLPQAGWPESRRVRLPEPWRPGL